MKNNGVELYVDDTIITEDKYIDGNAITIGAEGFKAFYQKDKFITGNKVNILRNKIYICKYIYLISYLVFNYTAKI